MQFILLFLLSLLSLTIATPLLPGWGDKSSESNDKSWTPSIKAAAAAEDQSYIVVLKPGLGGLLGGIIEGVLGKPLTKLAQFTLGGFAGFSAPLSDTAAEALRKNPNVAYVEKDGFLKTFGILHYTQDEMKEATLSKRATTSASTSTWALERLSQKTISTSPYTYTYDDTAGQGTCIYIIDSGIYTGHSEFNGVNGARATYVNNYVYGETGDDISGHGTAVAGAAAGNTFGLARKAQLYSIKVCNSSGNCGVSSVVSAISLAMQDSQSRSCPNGVILNLSLGGPSSSWQSVKDAVVAATQAGAFVVAAAGNDAANVANYLPASAAGACSVGATTSSDAVWAQSNRGSSLAVFAPGAGIPTAGLGSVSAQQTADGTSMSAPFVAGLGAYYWSKDGKGTTSAPGVALCNKIKSTSNLNQVGGTLGGSANRLAYNGIFP